MNERMYGIFISYADKPVRWTKQRAITSAYCNGIMVNRNKYNKYTEHTAPHSTFVVICSMIEYIYIYIYHSQALVRLSVFLRIRTGMD